MGDLRISCFLTPTREAPSYAGLAEDLGYDGVYVYGSPALFGDVWLSLGRMAEVTSRITLGDGVAAGPLVPTADGVRERQNRRVQIVYDGRVQLLAG